MSALGDIEDALVSRLGNLTFGGNPAFRMVRGQMISRSDAFPKELLRGPMPAATVSFRSLFFDDTLLSTVRFFSIYLASRNLRDQHDARHDADGSAGLFTLVESVNGDLDGATLATSFTSLLEGANTPTADSGTVTVRLTYSVQSQFSSLALTLDGNSLLASEALARLSVGSPRARVADFALASGNGTVRQVLGIRPRPVSVHGMLRAADDSALDTEESDLEALVTDPSTHTLSVPGGVSLSDCAVVSFERRGVRTTRWGSLPRTQRFVLRFEQLFY